MFNYSLYWLILICCFIVSFKIMTMNRSEKAKLHDYSTREYKTGLQNLPSPRWMII